MEPPKPKSRAWYACWQVWFCLFLFGMAWLLGLPLRLLGWLMSIFH